MTEPIVCVPRARGQKPAATGPGKFGRDSFAQDDGTSRAQCAHAGRLGSCEQRGRQLRSRTSWEAVNIEHVFDAEKYAVQRRTASGIGETFL